MFRHLYFSPVPRNDQEARERHTENTNAVVPLVDSHKDVVAVGVGDLDLVHLCHLLGDLAHHVLGVGLLIGESLANRAGGRGACLESGLPLLDAALLHLGDELDAEGVVGEDSEEFDFSLSIEEEFRA